MEARGRRRPAVPGMVTLIGAVVELRCIGGYSLEAGPGQRFSPYREDAGACVASAGIAVNGTCAKPAKAGRE